MQKSKVLIILITFFTFLFLFSVTSEENKPGTPEEVLKANIGLDYDSFKEVLKIIEVNDEGDALCIFETDGQLAVAYLNCVGNDRYKYGTAIEYPLFFTDVPKADISNLKAGDSDLLIKYSVTNDKAVVDNSIEKYTFSIGNSKQAFHLISIEDKKCFGYEYHLE
ncbi:MAG: hypothetical protein IJW86_01870 [Clostridia bacterium]|nr:hypothetical protein [Clostridia bacterium]